MSRLPLPLVLVAVLGCYESLPFDRLGFQCENDEVCAPEGVCVAGHCRSATESVRVAAAGGMACDPSSGSFNGGLGTATACRQQHVWERALAASPDLLLVLGDAQLPDGAPEKYQASYHPSWGRLLERTRPTPGNRDYLTAGASGYFGYFGERAGAPGQGYYSFDLGPWHVVALNSNCSEVGGCGEGSAQLAWLRQDLSLTSRRCVLAFWHDARFSSAQPVNEDVAPLWMALQAGGAELVLSGDVQQYERFAPQDAMGEASASGLRQFIVGTGGGRSLTPVSTPAAANSEAQHSAYGVLLLTLSEDGYAWEFEREATQDVVDQGEGSCR